MEQREALDAPLEGLVQLVGRRAYGPVRQTEAAPGPCRVAVSDRAVGLVQVNLGFGQLRLLFDVLQVLELPPKPALLLSQLPELANEVSTLLLPLRSLVLGHVVPLDRAGVPDRGPELQLVSAIRRLRRDLPDRHVPEPVRVADLREGGASELERDRCAGGMEDLEVEAGDVRLALRPVADQQVLDAPARARDVERADDLLLVAEQEPARALGVALDLDPRQHLRSARRRRRRGRPSELGLEQPR